MVLESLSSYHHLLAEWSAGDCKHCARCGYILKVSILWTPLKASQWVNAQMLTSEITKIWLITCFHAKLFCLVHDFRLNISTCKVSCTPVLKTVPPTIQYMVKKSLFQSFELISLVLSLSSSNWYDWIRAHCLLLFIFNQSIGLIFEQIIVP